MCGIVGIRRVDGAPVDPELIRRMTQQLVHRGPDADGYWSADGIAFGHRRLSIIDLAGSPQPMTAGNATICFNGEIFNYQALRKELAGEGYDFKTNGDTEVLLALYREKGPEGVKKTDGQFGYAIWDSARSDLWVYRDRVGVTPLYYYWDGKILAFASEIKALLPCLPDGPEIDDESVCEYLAYRSVPSPNTLFRGIQKLPPGHSIHLDASGRMQVEAWWKLRTEPSMESISPEAAVDGLDEVLQRAVGSRMVADVPVGAYLSGGVDSSMIVAMMARMGGTAGVETYSAGFADPRFDELPFAREVSEAVGTRHHEIIVEPSDFQSLWHKLTWHRDAPISEPADLAIFRLATLARESVKVLLSGEGSDELFAGYPKYAWAQKAGWADLMPSGLRGGMLTAIEQGLPARFGKPRIMLRAMAAANEADRFQSWFAPFVRNERLALTGGKAERDGHMEIWKRAEGDLIQRMLYVDCHTWLVDNLLERGDRMAMAASVESRPPFLDHNVVEYAFSLPSSVKLRDGVTKWVVKEVARRTLPAGIVDRKKVGFRVPLDSWFRSGLREMAGDMLLGPNSFVADRFDRAGVAKLLADHDRGRRDEEIRIWTLLCLEVWHDAFFKNRMA